MNSLGGWIPIATPAPISVYAILMKMGDKAVTKVAATYDGNSYLITIDAPAAFTPLEPISQRVSVPKKKKSTSKPRTTAAGALQKAPNLLKELGDRIGGISDASRITESVPARSRILISYRREDSADVTGRIDDRLVQEFGRQSVFVDVHSIPPGVDFRQHLDKQIARCKVLLAVIGPEWMGPRNWKRKTRLDEPEDFVRMEIEWALTRGIPLLVRGASIPLADQLPESIRQLPGRQSRPVRSDPDFHNDMNLLIADLKQRMRGRRGSK